MSRLLERIRHARARMRAEVLSPRWLLLWALQLGAVVLVFFLLGGRSETTVLSGTPPSGAWGAFTGLAFALSWLVFVVLAPGLAIAAGIAFLLEKAWRAWGGGERPAG